MKKQKAFTLSEVLITLVIIGVIAAITVPQLMANYRKQEVLSRLKKVYSSLYQAVKLAEIDKGIPFGSWDNVKKVESTDDWWNNNLGKYMPVQETTEVYSYTGSLNSTITPHKMYVFNDGTTMVRLYSHGMVGRLVLYVDVNGNKAPNVGGKDIFGFSVVKCEGGFKITGDTANTTTSCNDSYAREDLIRHCNAEYDHHPGYCTVLLMRDNWQFKDDYPAL
ncbi:MAG: type II secretion system GspH family protein [Candidatus Gastranaerophilales bacterium]|nr:type II secretion system GspH family protein [Candidatus Gastranaerophilales bacterium]